MKNTLLLIFTLFAIGAQGQYSTYNLNDYARPELKRETLVLGLDGRIFKQDDRFRNIKRDTDY